MLRVAFASSSNWIEALMLWTAGCPIWRPTRQFGVFSGDRPVSGGDLLVPAVNGLWCVAGVGVFS